MEVDTSPHREEEPASARPSVFLKGGKDEATRTSMGGQMGELSARIKALKDEQPRTAGAFAGYINLLKGCIGSGILGLPLAFSLSGWGYGLIILLAVGTVTAYGLFLLSACAHKLGGTRTSWGTLARSTYPWTSPLVDALIIFNCSGAAVSYLIVIGETLASLSVSRFLVPAGSFLANANLWRALVFWVLVAPLSSLRNLSSLRWSSMVGVIFVGYICILTVVYATVPAVEPCPEVLGPAHCGGEVVAYTDSAVGVVAAIPIFLFAFLASENLFLVYNEISDPSIKRMAQQVCNPMVATATIVFGVTAFCSYFTFGDLIQDNLVLNYPTGDLAVDVANIAIVFIVTASSPLKIHAARASGLSLVYFTLSSLTGSNPLRWWDGAFPRLMHHVMTGLLLTIIFLIGIFVSDLGLVFAIIGAIAATGLILYLPGFYFHRLYARDEAMLEAKPQAGPLSSLDAEKGFPEAQPLFSPFWLQFHREAALGMAITGIVLTFIMLGAIYIDASAL